MTEIKRSIPIEAPVNKVFAYASDYQIWTEWYKGVSEIYLAESIRFWWMLRNKSFACCNNLQFCPAMNYILE